MLDCSFCVIYQVEFRIVKLCAAMQWFSYLKGWSVSIYETKYLSQLTLLTASVHHSCQEKAGCASDLGVMVPIDAWEQSSH